MLDLVIRGGLVVTPGGAANLDVAVQGEQIVAVALSDDARQLEAGRVIDASGKIVVPGGVEPHTHIAHPIHFPGGARGETQSPEAASRAAVFGGTTTTIDFAYHWPGPDVFKTLEERKERFRGRMYTDYSFHCALLGDVAQEAIDQIPDVIKEGFASIKVFTCFGPAQRNPPNQVKDGHLWAIMQQVAKSDGIMAVHAEDEEIIEFMLDKLRREDKGSGEYIYLAHNNLSEDIAFRKVLRLAKATGAAVYFVHTTAKEGVAAVAEARAEGMAVYGEVLHHNLCFTSEQYHDPPPWGVCIHTYPSIKSPQDQEALWHGLQNGDLSTTATDEYTTSLQVKLMGKTVVDVTGGHNGIQTRIPIIFSEGVKKGRLSLERFVEVTSANAAKILGLYPRKGAIVAGSDADIAIIDPAARGSIGLDDLEADSDYSIWEGWQVEGWPVTTIARGRVVVENGVLQDERLGGRFLKRKISQDLLRNPVC